MPNGDVRVQTAAHEIGNGVYTVLGQMAAERLGVDLASVTVEVGISDCHRRQSPAARTPPLAPAMRL